MKIGLRTFILIPFLSAIFLLLGSCTFANRNATHILILAVDQFGYENLKCNKESSGHQKSGIEILCHDSIRFTHAYTTSQQTRPALASILTGRAPFINRVQDNDGSFLPASATTISEIAVQKGYETAFFVSSPVTLRNAGLQQGFQLFDDHYLAEKSLPYRHFSETKNSYVTWRGKQSKPTFALIHISDLYFKNRATQTELGEPRNYSYESQFENFDFILFQLLNQMKKEKSYDNTIIVLAGLNSAENVETSTDQNLDFNQDQIALLVKPTRKPRDIGLSWTFDENVSLMDIGKTFYHFFQFEEKDSSQPLLQTQSLLPSQANQHLAKIENRWIISESLSSSINPSRKISFRKNQFHLILQNGSYKIFNTLIDKLENSPLLASDQIHQQLIMEVKDLGGLVQKSSPPNLSLKKPDELELLLDLALGTKQKGTESVFKNSKINQHDLAVLKERLSGSHKTLFQNICLHEIDLAKALPELKQCHDKKILFLNELRFSQNELTDAQKKRLNVYHSELRILNAALQLNQQAGYPQTQPQLELKRWLPFLVAIQHPQFGKVKNLFLKIENR